jgi:thiamine-phosphate pyrophosphorylase
MTRDRVDWRLCFIADSEAAAGKNILELIGEAVDGGATLIQLRGKRWTSREFLDTGEKAVQFLRPKRVPLIVNDRVDIALACNADGVHLGQDDLPLPYARRTLGKKRIIGLSVSSPEEAEAAEKAGADYLGAGPILWTASKKDIGPVLGLEGLLKIRERVKIPILAIGGISAANATEVIAAGADGVAVISAVTAALDSQKAAAEIIEAIEKRKDRRR